MILNTIFQLMNINMTVYGILYILDIQLQNYKLMHIFI